ncbi:LGI1 [Branchiostoma lanceolatum]|uniref:LGI1 protein n=1 Tax=Branchiostoma lanceolatum TaxID=7740 RepID=A0A8J9ZEQ4_BRALA|nr:LGI1 [Branchiostoma lanceolatum]
MENRRRQCVAILVLLGLKFSLPCPEVCFVKHQFGKRKNCECPRQRVTTFKTLCVMRGFTVAANSVCSAENHGRTCLNDVPIGFDLSVTEITLNRLFNLTTLTKQHILPLPNLTTFLITGSTIQALAFVDLKSLHKIVLEGNQLKAVPFEALSLIRHSTRSVQLQVNLENNRISTVLETSWRNISDTYVTLRLKGNSLDCDSRLRWLVCNATTWQLTRRGHGDIVRAGDLQCTSPPELAGFDFQSLHNSSFCSSTELTTVFSMTMTSTSPITITSTFPMAEPNTIPAKSLKTTNSILIQQSTKSTSGTTESTRDLDLEKNLEDGQQAGMDYLYMQVGHTVAGLVLLVGMAVVVTIYKRRVLKGRPNPVNGQHAAIVSSQLIRSRMYQHSTTGEATDNEEADETEKDSARQNPVHKRHGITINTSELISNRLYKSSGSAINNVNKGTGTAEETELTPYLTVPFDAINNTLRIEPYSSVNLNDIRDADNDAGTTEETEENSELAPYRTVPFDAINNTLRIEPYSSVNLEDIRDADNDAVTTEETEENSELAPYRSVPFGAINNTLRIEPYSSVNLDPWRTSATNNRMTCPSASATNDANKDTGATKEPEQNLELNNILRIESYSSVNLKDIHNEETNVASGGISPSREHREHHDEYDIEPYCTTPLDQISDP